MKALLYKEFKLAMHPLCYLLILVFPLMMLIPSYPLAISFIYVLVAYPLLFLGANKGQQSNDLLFSVLLPVRKKDIVMARMITVLLMQAMTIAMSLIIYPIALYSSYTALQAAEEIVVPGLGFNSYVLLLAFVIIGYAVADLIFFPLYYRNGKSIVLGTLLATLVFVAIIAVTTIILPYIPGLEGINNLNLGIQFGALAGALIISFLLHWAVYKASSNLLEKVDF